MYNHETGLWEDPYIPKEHALIDGYGAREVGNYWTQDYISILSKALDTPQLEHEPDLEQ